MRRGEGRRGEEERRKGREGGEGRDEEGRRVLW